MPAPLDGLRVLDLTSGIAGPHATKLLADYGADVTKVEPPEGDLSRMWGPFKGDVPDPEASIPFLWLNTNKHSLVADLHTAGGLALVQKLVDGADVVVEDLPPGVLAGLGLDLGARRAARPALVVCSITPFGQTGPYAGLTAGDIVLQAMGGAMHATGHASREPLRLGGTYAEWHAGLAAALAILMAVHRAEQTGHGDWIDLSIYETQAGGKDRRQLALLGHAYAGLVLRRPDTAYAICSGARPCADGYINLLGNGPRLPAVLRMIGRPDLLTRPELSGPEEEFPGELVEEIEASYLAWTISHTMREAVAIAQQHRILGGAVYTVADTLNDPVFQQRGAFETIDHPATGPLPYPGRPFIMSDSPRRPARRAPLLDEHSGRGSVPPHPSSLIPHPSPPGDETRNQPPQPLPLQGVRVLDMSVVWAGPFAGQQLAEWGAEVIRMEPLSAIQPMTRHAERARHMSPESVSRAMGRGTLTMSYANRDPGSDPWNRGALFNASNGNKLSFTGNSAVAAGREAFERLVRIADVIIENNVPSTAEKLGVRYEHLREINPSIIVVRMPGFGLSGEYRDYRCWGNHLEGMAGHQVARAYPDMTLDATGETYACDSVAGLTAAVATVMALRHRVRTGRGQLVEVPQIEAFMQMLGVELLDYALNGRIAASLGNDHRTHAPHGVYPTVGSGAGGQGSEEDSLSGSAWIAIDIASDEHWRALCRVLRADDLAADERYTTMAGRWDLRRELDTALGGYTRLWDKWELFRALQGEGIAAGPVQDEAECFTCPHLAARGFFQEQTRADLGTHRYPGMLFQWQDTPNRHRRPAPTLGQDNEYVYRSLLGYDAEAYQAQIDAGEAGTAYPHHLLYPSPAPPAVPT
jgi:crotonobetainyl-CoA:carnitine CoA-transferase CaiB-like acyl-CoA transferase